MPSSPENKLSASFYLRNDVLQVSRELLGKVLSTRIDGRLTKAIITETEAYAGIDDKASHAFGGKRTRRTEPMFQEGGRAYVYLVYGIHHLFNVVSGEAGMPHAVLIRAGTPKTGTRVMLQRRGKDRLDKTLLAGPGSLASALGISTSLTNTSLQSDIIWIEDHGIEIPDRLISARPRIGVDYAGEDAELPYRFIAGL